MTDKIRLLGKIDCTLLYEEPKLVTFNDMVSGVLQMGLLTTGASAGPGKAFTVFKNIPAR